MNETQSYERPQTAGFTSEGPMQPGPDFVQYLKEYARQKPEVAALWCVGLGFILGWKLKPWRAGSPRQPPGFPVACPAESAIIGATPADAPPAPDRSALASRKPHATSPRPLPRRPVAEGSRLRAGHQNLHRVRAGRR